MSKVWLAMDMKLNKQWAVKEIDKRKEEYKRTVNEHQTLTEIEIMKKLSHPALPRIVSVIDEPNSLCVVMDYIEGESLDKVLKMDGRQPEEIVSSWTLDICDVLDYLHHQNPPIIYRDMKPSNVMLSSDGNIKIIDFGIAREYKGNRDDTLPLGTRGYASPEHFTKKTDARSDVYTVGVTMYQLLTGLDPAKPPYKILPLREVDPGMSTGLEKIITKATEQNPDDRYQSVQEMANAVAAYKKLDDEYIENLSKNVKSFKRHALFSTCILVIGIMMIIGGTFLRSRDYNALLNGSSMDVDTRVRELQKAITLLPQEKEAYIELIKTYAKDGKFTEQEAADFQTIYSENQEKLKRNEENYADVSYQIGEAFLKYYSGESDNSVRAKLLAAEPYFSAADVKGYKKKALASDYVFLAEYFKTYVIADDSLVADDAGKKDYKELLSRCLDVEEILEDYTGDGKEKIQGITYNIILNLLDGERNKMANAGIEKNEIEEVVKKMEYSLQQFDTESSEYEELQKNTEDISKRIALTYQRKAKETKK